MFSVESVHAEGEREGEQLFDEGDGEGTGFRIKCGMTKD